MLQPLLTPLKPVLRIEVLLTWCGKEKFDSWGPWGVSLTGWLNLALIYSFNQQLPKGFLTFELF